MTDKIDTSPAAIAAVLDGVTPGPWKWNVGAPRKSIDDIRGYSVIEAEEYAGACWIDVRHQDAAFIAAARDLVPALAAERDRLAAQLAESRAEGWRKGIEAAAAVNNFQAQEILDNAAPASAVNALRWAEKCIRALPMPAFGEPPA